LIRGIGVAALFAFLSFWWQAEGLIGRGGVLPFAQFLEAAADHFGATRFWQVPTLLWLSQSDAALHALCALGTLAASSLVAGRLRLLASLTAFACYLSIASVGREFTAFQWDTLLIECLIVAALASRAPTLGVWIARLLLVRFMLLSGVVKVLSGDPTWADGSALTYHFETQPLPTVLAWYAHQLPEALLQLGVWATLFIELALPIAIVLPRPARLFAGACFVGLELLIMLTGSYNFFNLLTIVLCVALLDDDLVRRKLRPISMHGRRVLTRVFGTLVLALGLLTTVLAFQQRPWPQALAFVQPWRIVNNYGVFAVMTTERRELTIEGSLDGLVWRRYEFPFKPGAPGSAPRLATPHQPRLDWQMWFAALGEPRHAPWIYDLAFALLEAKPDVLALLDDPFEAEQPLFVRINSSLYTFTSAREKRDTGDWWRVGPKSPWLEPIRLRRPRVTHSPLVLPD
jgi:hypothetical protein